MGCSSSKASAPTTQINNAVGVPDGEVKNVSNTEIKIDTVNPVLVSKTEILGDDKENNPSGHGLLINDIEHGQNLQVSSLKRKRSDSPSIKTDDGLIVDTEETEEQANKDVDTLNALFGCTEIDEIELIKIVVPVHSLYRNLLLKTYMEKFSKPLLQDLVRRGPSSCKALFEKIFLPIEEFLAVWLHQLVKTGNLILIVELLTAWPPSVIIDVKRSYAQEYKVPFEEDFKNSLDDRISQTVKVIVLSLAALQRVDDTREVEEDVSVLESDELSKGREQIIEVLTQKTYSKPQLASIFKEYKLKYYLDITDSIDIEFQDDAQEMLTTVVNIAEQPSNYFARQLQEIFCGAKLQTDRLLFLLAGRCEVDLPSIHEVYHEVNSRTFQEEIKNKYNGMFRNALLLLVNKFGGSVGRP